jgi:signal peptidase II
VSAHTLRAVAERATSRLGQAASRLTENSRWLLLSLVVVAVDQWSKALVEVHLPLYAAHPLAPGWLNLTHIRNTGVAFGLLSGRNSSLGLAVLGLIALVLVVVYFAFTHTRDRWLLAALSLVLGGAVGNLMDRIMSGAVTDFLDVYVGPSHWPSFNVADSAITVGIALLAFDVLRTRDSAPQREPEGAEEP